MRQQVQDLGGLPRLAPASSPTSGFGGGARLAGSSTDYSYVIDLGGRAQSLFAELSKRQNRRGLELARAEIADSTELVDQLLDATQDDPEARPEALARAQQQGLITWRDNPYHRLALAEAEGRRAGERAIEATRRRFIAGEHLPKEDERGNLTGGTDITAILDEELRRYELSPALRTEIGAGAFNGVVENARPALVRAAGDHRSQLELAHFQTILTDEIAAKVRLAQDVEPSELGGVLTDIEGLAAQMREAGVQDFRGAATEAVLRGVSLIGEDDPTRALELLNTAVADVRIAGQSLEENPRTAEMLANARHRFRRAADEDDYLEIRQRERREKEHLRTAEDFLSRFVREQVDGGASASETRRRARTAYENFLTQGSQAVELSPDAELLRREGLRLIDALTAETATTNPFVAEEMLTRVALARTPAELSALEEEVRALAGGDLRGKSLDALIGTIQDRRQVLGLGGLSSNPTFGRAWQDVDSIEAPAAAPLATRIQLGEQLRALDAEFQTSADRLARGGPVDEAQLAQLGREFADRKRQLVQTEEQRIDQQRQAMFEDVRQGATAGQIQSRYIGALSTAEVQEGISRAEQRQAFLRDLVNDPLVRSPLTQLTALAGEYGTAGGDADAVAFVLELEAEYERVLVGALQGKDLDFQSARGVLLGEGRRFVQERLARAQSQNRPTGGEDGQQQLPTGRELFGPPPTPEQRQRRVSELGRQQDLELAGARAAGAEPKTTARHPRLSQLVPPTVSSRFGEWQASAYRGGLLASVFDLPRLHPAEARASLEFEAVRSARTQGADPGRAYVAAVAPVGIPVDAVLAGETTVKAGRRLVGRVAQPGERPGMVGRLAYGKLSEPVPVRFQTADVPAFSTPLFDRPAQVERFVNGRPEDFDRLMGLWGIEDEEEQKAWVRVQAELARRQERANARGTPRWSLGRIPTEEL